eukprot:364861-Chlamydomonas_euryale.AAC.9
MPAAVAAAWQSNGKDAGHANAGVSVPVRQRRWWTVLRTSTGNAMPGVRVRIRGQQGATPASSLLDSTSKSTRGNTEEHPRENEPSPGACCSTTAWPCARYARARVPASLMADAIRKSATFVLVGCGLLAETATALLAGRTARALPPRRAAAEPSFCGPTGDADRKDSTAGKWGEGTRRGRAAPLQPRSSGRGTRELERPVSRGAAENPPPGAFHTIGAQGRGALQGLPPLEFGPRVPGTTTTCWVCFLKREGEDGTPGGPTRAALLGCRRRARPRGASPRACCPCGDTWLRASIDRVVARLRARVRNSKWQLAPLWRARSPHGHPRHDGGRNGAIRAHLHRFSRRCGEHLLPHVVRSFPCGLNQGPLKVSPGGMAWRSSGGGKVIEIKKESESLPAAVRRCNCVGYFDQAI